MRTTGGLRLMAIAGVTLLLAGCAANSPLAQSWPLTTTVIKAAATTAATPTRSSARKTTLTRPTPSRARLASAVLRTGDVPKAWIHRRHLTYDKMGAWPVSIVASCLGVRDTDRALVTTADSGNFDRKWADLLVRVAGYRSQTAVDSDAAAVFRPKFAPCYLRWERFHGIVAPGAKISGIRAHVSHRIPTQPANVIADLEASFVLSGHDTSDRIYSEEIWIRGRDTEATVDFMNTDSPVPAKFRAQVVATVARRIAKL